MGFFFSEQFWVLRGFFRESKEVDLDWINPIDKYESPETE